MDEGAKESPKAGGDPGASMVKKKHLQSRIVTPKAGGLGPRTSRPRKNMRAVSLDDLTRKVVAANPSSRRGGGVGKVLVTCAHRHSPRNPRRPRRPAAPPDADGEGEEGAEGEEEEGEGEEVEDGGCIVFRSAALEEEGAKEERAARLICSVLMLRCWRRRRAEAGALGAALAEAQARAEGLALQAHVLRQLLDRDRQRMADAADDARRSYARVDRLEARLHESLQALEAEGAQAQQLRANNGALQEELGRARADAVREVQGLQEEQRQMVQQLQMLKAHESQLQEQMKTLERHLDAQARDRLTLQASILHFKCEKARLEEELRRCSWLGRALWAGRRLAAFSFSLFDLLLPYSRA